MLIRLAMLMGVLLSVNAASAKSFQDHVRGLGFTANVTSAGVIQDQQAGYYSGGGITMRSQVQNMSLGHLQLPSVKAGCGGIDLYNGSFSFINAQAFEALGANIIQNSLGYIFELGIDTLSPQMANSLAKIRSILNAINN